MGRKSADVERFAGRDFQKNIGAWRKFTRLTVSPSRDRLPFCEKWCLKFLYLCCRYASRSNAQDKGNFSDVTDFEQLMQLGRSGKLDANDSHIIHICDWLFTYAFQQRASDIHLENL